MQCKLLRCAAGIRHHLIRAQSSVIGGFVNFVEDLDDTEIRKYLQSAYKYEGEARLHPYIINGCFQPQIKISKFNGNLLEFELLNVNSLVYKMYAFYSSVSISTVIEHKENPKFLFRIDDDFAKLFNQRVGQKEILFVEDIQDFPQLQIIRAYIEDIISAYNIPIESFNGLQTYVLLPDYSAILHALIGKLKKILPNTHISGTYKHSESNQQTLFYITIDDNRWIKLGG